MKVGQNIGFIDISDEFENGRDRCKNMGASGRGIFSIFISWKREHSRSHIFGPIFMKFGQNICFLDTRVEFENDSGQLNNMAVGGGILYLYSKEKSLWTL